MISLFLLGKPKENTQHRIITLKLVSDRPTAPPQNEFPQRWSTMKETYEKKKNYISFFGLVSDVQPWME